jgi:hypothetical protein
MLPHHRFGQPKWGHSGFADEYRVARPKSNKYQNNLNAGKGAMQTKIICMASAWPRGAYPSRMLAFTLILGHLGNVG